MKLMDPIPIRLLTHNIRYATNSPFKGEELWHTRKSRLIAELRFNTGHCSESFICLQEVLHEQLHDILSCLNGNRNTWTYIGVGRDDGYQAGEYSPILYQSSVWQLQSYETVWLSKTPDRPSKSWDAASIRILTIGVFRHSHSKKTIIAMNTHLDDQGSKSRLEATKIILERISHFMSKPDGSTALPIFLAGDLNSEQDQEAYKVMTSEESPMCDLQDLIPENQRYGDQKTFTGFGHERSPPKRIDFLFLNHHKPSAFTRNGTSVNEARRWSAEGYGVLANQFDDGIYCSDHRAVVGDLFLF
ncbi:hypothetical protein MMC29_000175 [Sticta canariensis]|nr:hypothetical protein [Sticta canariensis]